MYCSPHAPTSVYTWIRPIWSYASQWSWWRSSVCHHQEGDWAPWAWIPPSRDSHTTAAGIAQSACLEGSGSIHEPSCHTNTFFRKPIFVHSPDHHFDLLFTDLKAQLQEMSKCRTIHEDWVEQGMEGSSGFPFSRKEMSDSIQSGIFLGQTSDYSQLKTYSCSTKLITYWLRK